jgi:glycosyltransferase involved in cell wall biosynthesis
MISLITPNYNGARWIDECLRSVADQSLSQELIEMIIIDDGSTDRSLEIIEGYKQLIHNLKIVPHAHVGRPGELRNLAIDIAMGDYVLFLDSDDYLGTEALERLHDFVDKDPTDVIAFQLEGLGRSVPSSMLRTTARHVNITASGVYKTLGIWKMCRRDFLDQHNIRFPIDIGRADDVIFFAEAMLKADTVSVLSGYPFYTVRGRMDGSSITQKPWPHIDRIRVAEQTALTIIKWAKTQSVADHFMIRVFNSDAMAVIADVDATEDELSVLKSALSPFWSSRVAKLIYTDENRRTLLDFFGGKNE